MHLEPEELQRLFKTLEPYPFWYGYFRLQYYFGCRVSEVSAVLKEDVSYSAKQIVIRRLKKRDGKGFSESVYQMPPGLIKVLKAVPHHPQNPWFFPAQGFYGRRAADQVGQARLSKLRHTDDGWCAVSRTTAHRAFKEAALAAEIPAALAHSHVLRHTRATLMLADGANEAEVSALLGHSSVNTTRKYLGQARALRLRVDTVAQLGDF